MRFSKALGLVVFTIVVLVSSIATFAVASCPGGTCDCTEAVTGNPGDVYTLTSADSVTNTQCSGHGLALVAGSSDGVILDCNGLTLQSSNSGSQGIGVYVEEAQGVTIQNCNIRNFNYGVLLYESVGSTINNNDIRNTVYYGILLDASIPQTMSIPGGDRTESNVITGNTVRDNQRDGIYLRFASSNTVSSNVVENNNYGIVISHGSMNPSGAPSNNNQIVSNTVQSNRNYGIYLTDYTDGNSLTSNTVSNNGRGIHLSSLATSTLVNSNLVCTNTNTDIFDAGTQNSGDRNTCDSAQNWNDQGTTGCTLSCSSGGGSGWPPANSWNTVKVKPKYSCDQYPYRYVGQDDCYEKNKISKQPVEGSASVTTQSMNSGIKVLSDDKSYQSSGQYRQVGALAEYALEGVSKGTKITVSYDYNYMANSNGRFAYITTYVDGRKVDTLKFKTPKKDWSEKPHTFTLTAKMDNPKIKFRYKNGDWRVGVKNIKIIANTKKTVSKQSDMKIYSKIEKQNGNLLTKSVVDSQILPKDTKVYGSGGQYKSEGLLNKYTLTAKSGTKVKVSYDYNYLADSNGRSAKIVSILNGKTVDNFDFKGPKKDWNTHTFTMTISKSDPELSFRYKNGDWHVSIKNVEVTLVS